MVGLGIDHALRFVFEVRSRTVADGGRLFPTEEGLIPSFLSHDRLLSECVGGILFLIVTRRMETSLIAPDTKTRSEDQYKQAKNSRVDVRIKEKSKMTE